MKMRRAQWIAVSASIFLFPWIVSAQEPTTSALSSEPATSLSADATDDAVVAADSPAVGAEKAEWQVVENGAPSGPFTVAQIRQRIAAGLIAADQLVWKAGMTDWAPAQKTAPFDTAFSAGTAAADVAPPPIPTATPAVETVVEPQTEPSLPRSGGWALAGAILGYSMSAVILGTGAAAAAIYETDVSVPLGAAAWSTNLVFGPVVFAAGASARHRGGVRGSLGARISAWVFYGIAVGIGAAEIGLGAAGEDVPIGAIIPAVIATTVSQLLFSTDALVAAIQVKHENASVPTTAARSRLTIGPLLAPTASSQFGNGGIVGFGGSFR